MGRKQFFSVVLIYADVAKFIDDNLDNSLEDLKKLVRIPTVAAKGEGLPETPDLVEKMLQEPSVQQVLPLCLWQN